MLSIRAVCSPGEGKILKRAFQFDWRVLQSVEIDEVTFIKVCVPSDILPVDLVEHSNVLCQVVRVVETVKAFAGPKLAEAFNFFLVLVNDALICHEGVARQFKRTFNLVINVIEAAQASLMFHLIFKDKRLEREMAGKSYLYGNTTFYYE